jgi:cellobiose phosphorylase
VDDPARTVSADRTEFLGRNSTLRSPAAMTRSWLSGKVGAALDPCAAYARRKVRRQKQGRPSGRP